MQMSEEKFKKIVVGATVAGVLLALFLVVILVIQFVQMGTKAARLQWENEEKTRLETELKKHEGDLEYYSSYQGLLRLAYQYGYIFPDDAEFSK